MPRINQIRVANIHYDDEKKQIPNLSFTLRGQDCILLLANGGGKTLLIQLILQTILPNVMMNRRRMVDLLKSKRFTGHVAIEWILDGEGEREEYVCAGFAFTKGYDDEGLRYFNYLFHYGEGAELNIASLPLIKTPRLFKVEREEPISYQELKDFLRKHQHAQIFEQQKGLYQKQLEMYHILAEEWKRIRDTNGTEGGVDKFFENCRSTAQLVENLLIPSVEGILFQSEAKKREILKSFSTHRSMLLEIPILKADLKDFQVIREDAEKVVSAVKELHHFNESLQETLKKVVELAITLGQKIREEEERLDAISKEREALSKERGEKEWQLASHEVFLIELKLSKAQGEWEKKREELRLEEEREAALKRESLETEALYHDYLAKALQEKIGQLATEIRSLDEKEPELKDKLREARREALPLWEREKERIEDEKRGAEERIISLKERASVLSQEMERAERLIGENNEAIHGLKYWLEEFRALKKELAHRKIPLMRLGEPYQILDERREGLEALKREGESLQKRLEDLEKKREELIDKRERLALEMEGLKLQNTTIEEKLETFEEKKDIVESELAAGELFMHFTKEIFDEKEEILDNLWREQERVRESRVIKQGELWSIEERWALIERRNYYVPHGVLIKIKIYLDEKGIYTILGSEWLAAQSLTTEEKEELVQENPLLPYSILIEAKQLKAAKRGLEKMKGLTLDFPLLFILKKDLAKREEPEKMLEDGLLIVGQSRLFKPSSWEIFLSTTKFASLKEGLDEERNQKREELYAWKRREEEMNRLQNLVKPFFDTYSKQRIESWLKEKREGERHLVELREKVKEVYEKKNRLKREEEALRLQEKSVEESIRDAKDVIKRLEEFAKQSEQLPLKSREIKEKTLDVERLKKEKRSFDQEKEGSIRERAYLEKELEALFGKLNEHREEFNRLGLEDLEPLLSLSSYEEKRAQIAGLVNSLSSRDQNRAQLEERLSEKRNEYHAHLEEIEERGISKEWLKENRREVQKEEVKEKKREHERQWKALKIFSEGVVKAEARAEHLSESRESVAKRIERAFERSPYLEFSATNHEEELCSFQEELQQLKLMDTELKEKIIVIERWKKKMEEGLHLIHIFIEREQLHDLKDQVTPKEEAPEDPKTAVEEYYREKEKVSKAIEEQKREVEQLFNHYLHRLERTENGKVRQFKNQVKAIMQNHRLFDYSFVSQQFSRILEALDNLSNQVRNTLQESQKNMEILTDRCLRRAKTVYENIVEIPKNARVHLFGRDMQVIRMDWNILGEEEGRKEIHRYLSDVLKDLQEWKEQGQDDDAIDRKMEEMIRTRNLIEVMAPIKDCQVRVYKPRKESIMSHHRLEYSPWDEVKRWSGGEEYSIYVAMFMIIISHIREQLEGRPDTWKVILADNPFGRASSSHILEVVFQIAKSNNIQFICLTAHKQEEILRRFPVVYSLLLRSAYGREVMQAEEMETGYYLEPV